MNPAKKGLGRGLSALFGDIEKKSSNKFSLNFSEGLKRGQIFIWN